LALDKVSSGDHTTVAFTSDAWILGDFLSNKYVVYKDVVWAKHVEGMEKMVDTKKI